MSVSAREALVSLYYIELIYVTRCCALTALEPNLPLYIIWIKNNPSILKFISLNRYPPTFSAYR